MAGARPTGTNPASVEGECKNPRAGEPGSVHERSEKAKDGHDRKCYLSLVTSRIRPYFMGYGHHPKSHQNQDRQQSELIPRVSTRRGR